MPDRRRIEDLIAGGALAVGDGYRAKNQELSDAGVPFARAANISGGLRFEGADRFPEDDLKRVGEKVSRPGDVVFTSKGTVGRVAYVSEDTPRFVFSPQLCYWRSLDGSRIDSRYLYYWLLGPEFFAQYMSVKGQTDMADYVSLRDQRRMLMTLPPISEQRAIAGVLGALDDKIELNRRMNETLDWLAELRFARLNADASPSWRDGSVADLGDFVNGRNFTKDATGTGRMVIRIAELSSAPGASTVYNDVEAPEQHVATADDILFAWSGSLGVYRWRGDDALVNQHIFKVIPRVPQWFAYRHLRKALPRFREIAADKATTMGHIKRGHLSEVKLKMPPPDVVESASAVIQPLEQKIAANEAESKTLAELRDALLPKLISGELRVRDAEATVEAAAEPKRT